ncbi:MAG: BACON domain-containing protein [Rikenellaceae bacterium]|nr:BACON domain-containing protein [Rikenellaceae bacterium]
MKQLLKLTLGITLAVCLTNCAVEDVAEIRVEQPIYSVSADGGELIIPVTSTGIDNVQISYRESYYEWEVDENTGDLYPAEGWININRVINNYTPKTRDLPLFYSAVCLQIAPNTSTVERQASIRVTSFNKSAGIQITQLRSLNITEE